MVTAAIINAWDGVELLPYAVDNWRACGIDKIIIIYSNTSNYGQFRDNTAMFRSTPAYKGCEIIKYEPVGGNPMASETMKRNFGLAHARALGATHFVTADVDEFYDPSEFKRDLKRFESGTLNGLCCASRVYFKRPTLTIGLDITIVPFIHVLHPSISHGLNRLYPFAFKDGGIRIDPTRQLSYRHGIEWSDIIMEHYSWCRHDIESKILNSTARYNIEKSDVREEFKVAEDGYFLKFYGRTLYTVENKFNLPDYGGRSNLGQDVSHGGKPAKATHPASKS